jgi:hypothetical protein
MAKTGDTPDRKPKARSRASRPSFAPAAPAATPQAGSAWVYRSDAETPRPAPVTRQAVAKDATKPSPKPAAKAAPRRAPAPVAAPVARNSGGLTHALDVVTLPLAVSLMAVLAPMRRLLGPRH